MLLTLTLHSPSRITAYCFGWIGSYLRLAPLICLFVPPPFIAAPLILFTIPPRLFLDLPWPRLAFIEKYIIGIFILQVLGDEPTHGSNQMHRPYRGFIDAESALVSSESDGAESHTDIHRFMVSLLYTHTQRPLCRVNTLL